MNEMLKKKIAKAGKKTTAWNRGVIMYAIDLVDGWDRKEDILRGAKDWSEFSHSGLALTDNEAIARRLCTDGGFIRSRRGHRPPNKTESWMGVQAKALEQAWALVNDCINEM